MATSTGATRPLQFDPQPTGKKKKKKGAAVQLVTSVVPPTADPPARAIRHKRKHPPANETSRDKFIRLVTSRVTTATTAIRLIGNLANRHVYQYEDEDIPAIRSTLIASIDEALSQFTKKKRAEIKFVLPVVRK